MFDLGRKLLIEIAQGWWRPVTMPLLYLFQAAGEGKPLGKELIGDNAQAIEVAAIFWSAREMFRRHIGRGAGVA